jgi:hypothetical protein
MMIHRDVEDRDAPGDVLHADPADRAAYDHGGPDGRRQKADAQVQDHDDAEMDRVGAELLDNGQEDWRARFFEPFPRVEAEHADFFE